MSKSGHPSAKRSGCTHLKIKLSLKNCFTNQQCCIANFLGPKYEVCMYVCMYIRSKLTLGRDQERNERSLPQKIFWGARSSPLFMYLFSFNIYFSFLK